MFEELSWLKTRHHLLTVQTHRLPDERGTINFPSIHSGFLSLAPLWIPVGKILDSMSSDTEESLMKCFSLPGLFYQHRTILKPFRQQV